MQQVRSRYFIRTDGDENYTFVSSNLTKAIFETFASLLQTTIFNEIFSPNPCFIILTFKHQTCEMAVS
jgi:hypothetical protein